MNTVQAIEIVKRAIGRKRTRSVDRAMKLLVNNSMRFEMFVDWIKEYELILRKEDRWTRID